MRWRNVIIRRQFEYLFEHIESLENLLGCFRDRVSSAHTLILQKTQSSRAKSNSSNVICNNWLEHLGNFSGFTKCTHAKRTLSTHEENSMEAAFRSCTGGRYETSKKIYTSCGCPPYSVRASSAVCLRIASERADSCKRDCSQRYCRQQKPPYDTFSCFACSNSPSG